MSDSELDEALAILVLNVPLRLAEHPYRNKVRSMALAIAS